MNALLKVGNRERIGSKSRSSRGRVPLCHVFYIPTHRGSAHKDPCATTRISQLYHRGECAHDRPEFNALFTTAAAEVLYGLFL